ncbi:uncharacterized protein LOC123311702 [Coccinella septempunctata]|uniref:uncharacterized protein LOC123311702 n=1 Tax=Coccinella septempunctata TaxID=41139 RepID=UPI001D06F16C|nr:uncharacterized protein LOC123311702 [Coccinella septempunctata]
MDKTQYKELADTLLQDEQYYKQLPRDPTTSMQNRCNAVIKSLLPDNYIIISLDVISLFNNIYLDLAVSAIESKWQLINNHTSIPKEEFLNIINFLFTSNYFVFDGIFYLQILGSPMGSNSSSPIADIVMDFILDNVLSDVPFHIPFIKKYVDDIICAVPEEQRAVQYCGFVWGSHPPKPPPQQRSRGLRDADLYD